LTDAVELGIPMTWRSEGVGILDGSFGKIEKLRNNWYV
jgi:hypothetical protein